MSIKHLASLNVTGSVTASNGVITVTTDGTPTIVLPDGAIAVDTTNDKIYFRSGGEWQEVIGGGGGGIAIQPEAPIDTELLWLDTDEPGVSGPTGPTGATGPAGVTTGSTAPANTSVIWADTSETGTAVIPLGGTTGQVLAKSSSSDYATEWSTPVTSSDLALKANLAGPTFTGTVSGITKTMVGLGSVDNTADTAKPVSTAQQTALNLKANIADPTFTGTVSGVTKTMVGLGSVDNTADTAKPVSTAQQTALNLKANIAGPTFTGTVSATTVNSTNYQQGGNAGSIVRSASVSVPFNTSNQLHLVNMPSGCNVFNLINVHPTTGVNNTVTITEVRYGDWSGVQTTGQIGITGYLGNGVHLESFAITFYWLA